MPDLRLKRKSLELVPLEKWLHAGRSRFHFENVEIQRSIIRRALRIAGLYDRGCRNALDIRVREIGFEFDNLPPSFDGFRILYMADIHADGVPGLAEAVCDRIRDLTVDLCLLGGDYRFAVHGPCHNVYPPMRKMLAAVNSRGGIFGILGNHDFAEEARELESMGVRMLMNQAAEIRQRGERLWVVGLDDPHYYGCDDLDAALRGVGREAFKILLVHTPEMIREAEQNGFSLYLCGHTHGGQVCLPLIGPVILHAKCPRRYTRGKWKLRSLYGYTTAGLGCSLVPVRFLCQPEICLIRLQHRGHSA